MKRCPFPRYLISYFQNLLYSVLGLFTDLSIIQYKGMDFKGRMEKVGEKEKVGEREKFPWNAIDYSERHVYN